MRDSPPVHPATPADLALYRACRVVAVGSSLAAFPGRVLGKEHLPKEGSFILAPTHRSYLDWLIVARVTRRRLRYLVKAEVWRSKAVGRLIEALGAFPVNRSGADREALERCEAVLQQGEPLVMFPEGTRRSGPTVAELREGVAYLALRTGAAIVPVGLAGTEEAMPRGSSLPRPRRVDIVIGPPIIPPARAEEGSQRRGRVSRRATAELSALLRERLQEALDEAVVARSSTTLLGRPHPGRTPGREEDAHPGPVG